MRVNKVRRSVVFSVFVFFLALAGTTVKAQTTAFTYQGVLTDGGNPANGAYDLQFKLFSALTGGTQQGATVALEDVPVSNGIFKVTLNFGAPVFSGADRFLEIGVRPGASTGTYTTLAPRQQLTSTPYAIRTLSAAEADSLSAACVNCVTSGQIASVAASQITGTLPASAIPAGSGNYIQNAATEQASSNFNISGDGKAAGTMTGNIVNATMQFNLNGTRILTKFDTNLIAGEGAGATLTKGNYNAFFGYQAGNNTTDGHSNTFLGSGAGRNNMGQGGTADLASYNTFIGRDAGFSNTHGLANTFVGRAAGMSNQSSNNSFFGERAGLGNTTGSNNSFFGQLAGFNNTTGSNNVFLGNDAGQNNTIGNNNVFIGNNAKGSSATLTNAVAIGTNAQVSLPNSLILGGILGVNGASQDTRVGIGTTAPESGYRLSVINNNSGFLGGIHVNSQSGSGIISYGSDAGVYSTGSTGVYGRGGYLGYGVEGHSSGGTGVYGNGGSYGVQGYSFGGAGVFGRTDGTTGIGVHGLSSATTGVYGSTDTGIGVYGISFATGYGVAGYSANDYAGYFPGYLFSNFIIKGGGTFKIDHPLDPENKYLSHSFVESPDMKNIYDGVVKTDETGLATVLLPGYFEALNRDFRYQLTVIGDFAQAIVANKIRNNRFTIKTDKPNVEVSWQVTGIRQDAFANAHRVPNEEDKPAKERGHYLHPEVYGQPEEKGVEWAKNPELMRRLKEERERPRIQPTNPLPAPAARSNNR